MSVSGRRDPRLAQIYAAARKHRRALEKRNADASEAMYQAWRVVLEDLRPRIDAITQRIDDARAAGETVNPAWLYQQARYRELLDASRTRFNQYAYLTEQVATGLQSYAATEAISAAYDLVRGAFGVSPDPLAPDILIRPGAEELKDIVGFLGNGSPLRDLLATFGDQAAEGIGKAITAGVVTGQSPIEIARAIRRAAGIPRTRAETIARTELHRAFRTATQRTFETNADVISGWIWHSAQQRRTCAACWAMHGTFHPVTEMLRGHVRCRCAMLPQTKTWEEIGIEGVQDERVTIPLGADLFAQLSAKDQRFILGKTKYDMFKAGEITLPDLATLHKNPVWGDSWQEATIKQAREAAEARQNAAKRALTASTRPKTQKAPKDQGAAPTAPDFKPGAQVRAEIEAYGRPLVDQIKGMERDLPRLAREANEAYTKYSNYGYGPDRDILYRDWGAKFDKHTALKVDIAEAKEKLRSEILERWLYTDPATFKVQGAPRKANDRSSSEQLERSNTWEKGIDSLRRLIGTGHVDDKEITYHRKPDEIGPDGKKRPGRAYQSGNGIWIGSPAHGYPGRVIVHEIGHWIEDESSGIHQEIVRHFQSRTAGETPVKLKDLYPTSNYRDDEYTKRDKWISLYSGKEYVGNSEILSMTLEQLHADPFDMIEQDPDTFDVVWRLLRSKNLPPKTRRRRS